MLMVGRKGDMRNNEVLLLLSVDQSAERGGAFVPEEDSEGRCGRRITPFAVFIFLFGAEW